MVSIWIAHRKQIQVFYDDLMAMERSTLLKVVKYASPYIHGPLSSRLCWYTGAYQPKQYAIKGKSLQMTIDLHCDTSPNSFDTDILHYGFWWVEGSRHLVVFPIDSTWCLLLCMPGNH